MDPSNLILVTFLIATLAVAPVQSEDPYVVHNWDVKFKSLSPMGVPQKVITINDQFPGPRINSTSNNNIVVNVINNLGEPLLFTWNAIQQRKNSWQEGMPGTNCPILPGTNYTFKFQVKDQIGTYYYYPTTALHRAAGGYGSFVIHSRPLIPIPFDKPEEEFIVLAGDWYSEDHVVLKKKLDNGEGLGKPAGMIINGKRGEANAKDPMFFMAAGKTYRYRICNVGMTSSFNIRFQEHDMKLVEVEGSHTVHNKYDSLDVHLGQCSSVLVTADKPPKDYLMVVSTRFTTTPVETTAIIRYNNSNTPAGPKLPKAPEDNVAWSLEQFRSLRWNLTASAARPNPQGTYHYGKIKIAKTIKLVDSTTKVDGKTRYALNGVSHIDPETPLKLAEFFGVADKVFKYNLITDNPPPDGKAAIIAPNVLNTTYKDFIEIVFENHDKTMQTYHLAGYSFFAVGMDTGVWSLAKRKNYNLVDAVSRNTVQVYPGCWSAILLSFDNWGLWNLRSTNLERQYLGQQLYLNVQNLEKSPLDENPMPEIEIMCGIVKGLPHVGTVPGSRRGRLAKVTGSEMKETKRAEIENTRIKRRILGFQTIKST